MIQVYMNSGIQSGNSSQGKLHRHDLFINMKKTKKLFDNC
jgi:hypothetical protein